jgi:hypothetical protein
MCHRPRDGIERYTEAFHAQEERVVAHDGVDVLLDTLISK